jgi:hypothetical protein
LFDKQLDTLIEDPKGKADLLGKQFARVFTQEPDLKEPIPSTSSTNDHEPICSISITESLVLKKLKAINTTKSLGPDKLHPRVLRETADLTARLLTIIFQKSLDKGELPSVWKRAVVSPIFKSGKREIPANYRPISLTSIPCKILESIISDHILVYLKSKRILTDKQFGFLKKTICGNSDTRRSGRLEKLS